MDDLTLSEATFTHIVEVPIEKFDIAGWLFSLPDAEFQRCCVPDHVAAGQTVAGDGRRMSINVEKIGDSLVVQHYVAEIAERHFCQMLSISDVFTPLGHTKTRVLWELRAASAGEGRTEYTNYVRGSTTEDFMAFISQNGISYEDARSARQAASSDHCRREHHSMPRASRNGHFLKVKFEEPPFSRCSSVLMLPPKGSPAFTSPAAAVTVAAGSSLATTLARVRQATRELEVGRFPGQCTARSSSDSL